MKIYPQAENSVLVETSDGQVYQLWDGAGPGLQISLMTFAGELRIICTACLLGVIERHPR